MEKLKECLKRWPRGYVRFRAIYYALLYLGETQILGSRIHEWIWRRRHEPSLVELTASAAHPHRDFLISQIAKWTPFESVLEIGCNAGQNLLLLAGKFPGVIFRGIDINPRFIEVGKEWCAREGVKNVLLQVGRADDLASFADRSVDITFTDATLMYVGPDKIGRTFQGIKRVTRKALVFNEWSLDVTDSSERSLWYDFHWVHNYSLLLEKHVAGSKIRMTRLPKNMWARGGGWEKYGALVEVDL